MLKPKYRVYKQNIKTSEKLYKRYKTIEGWTRDPSICWQFSKTGAQAIRDRINRMYAMYNVKCWIVGIEVCDNG